MNFSDNLSLIFFLEASKTIIFLIQRFYLNIVILPLNL